MIKNKKGLSLSDSLLKNNYPHTFNEYINNNSKSTPLNINTKFINKSRYAPAYSKEWINTIYNYNYNFIKNIPVYDLNINSLIKNYFNLYFNYKYIQHKYISRRDLRKSLNKIYVSKAEIKHTSTKVLITIYVYNRERFTLLKKILGFSSTLSTTRRKLTRNVHSIFFKAILLYIRVQIKKLISSIFKVPAIQVDNEEHKLLPVYLQKELQDIQFSNKRSSFLLYKLLSSIRRYKLRLNLNKYKFEEKFLTILSGAIGKYYNKKVEFNIIKLKSLAYNKDIFLQILRTRLEKRKAPPMKMMNILLSKISIPKRNIVLEKSNMIDTRNRVSLHNKYKSLNISTIFDKYVNISHFPNSFTTEKDSLNKFLYNIYCSDNVYNFISSDEDKSKNFINNDSIVRKAILDSIKYKNMGGVRLRVKGRLTRRYRADRAIYKLRWKGGLKNIDSSYKGLSSIMFRGYLKSNIERSIIISKRRIGSFAAKGWFSAK